MARSCYEVLGVAQTASPEEVKTAYAAILREIRAGIAAGKGDAGRLFEAREAYATLSDTSRRAAYDLALAKDARDIADVPVEMSPRAIPGPSPKQPNFFVRAWRGEVKAWKIFWFLYVPSWLLLGLMPLGLVVTATVSGAALMPQPGLWMLTLVVIVVLAIGPVMLWRCAFNVSWRPLGLAARVCIVLLALFNVVLTGDAYRRLSGALPAAAKQAPISKDRELLVASQRGDLKKVKALIADGADVKLEDTDPRNKARTALHWAAGAGHYEKNGQHLEVARVLLAHGADVNAQADGGYTPLHVAAGLAQVDMVRWLLDNGADINAKDRRGTPLEAAALQGHEAVVAVLLERKPRLDRILRVYHIMGTYYPSHTPILRRLLDAGAEVNEVDDQGSTPVDYVAHRSEDAVLLLLSRGADLSAGRRGKGERLGVIVRAGHLKAVEQLFSKGLDPGTRGKNGETLMHDGVGAGEQMVKLLHAKGVRHDLPDSKGDQPIHYAARGVRQDAVQWLLSMKVPADAEGAGSSTPLMECVKSTQLQLEIAKVLLASGASVAKRDTKGYAALDHAKSADMVVLLVRHGARVDGADALGYTALHRVVFEPPTRALLDAGASVHARTKSGRTPLHTSVESWNLVKLLLEKGADVAAADHDGMTPLHLAARAVNSSSVRELLAAGASVKVQDKYGRTPLHYAAEREMFPVQALVKAGAELNVRDREGNTPLHFAARASNPKFAVAEMIKLGADADAKNADGKTAMQLAESAQAAIDRKFAKPVATK